MKEIKMVEVQSVDIDMGFHCKYCKADLIDSLKRVDVIDYNSNRILYVYCQTHDCMMRHLAEFYGETDIPIHNCYDSACLEYENK